MPIVRLNAVKLEVITTQPSMYPLLDQISDREVFSLRIREAMQRGIIEVGLQLDLQFINVRHYSTMHLYSTMSKSTQSLLEPLLNQMSGFEVFSLKIREAMRSGLIEVGLQLDTLTFRPSQLQYYALVQYYAKVTLNERKLNYKADLLVKTNAALIPNRYTQIGVEYSPNFNDQSLLSSFPSPLKSLTN